MDVTAYLQRFESSMSSFSGDDPLDPWLKFLEFLQQRFPAGGDSELVLERLLHTFLLQERFANDVRFVDCCVRRARLHPDPPSLLEELFRRGVGTRTSALFLAWAQILEQRGQNQQAHSVFQRGLDNQALPQDQLLDHYRQFLKRTNSQNTAVGPLQTSHLTNQLIPLRETDPPNKSKPPAVSTIVTVSRSENSGAPRCPQGAPAATVSAYLKEELLRDGSELCFEEMRAERYFQKQRDRQVQEQRQSTQRNLQDEEEEVRRIRSMLDRVQQDLETRGALSRSQQGPETQGALTQVQQDLDVRGAQTQIQQDLDVRGAQTQVQRGLQTHGALMQLQQDLNVRGAQTQVQWGLQSQGTMTQVQQYLETRGAHSQIQQGPETQGALTQVHPYLDTQRVLSQVHQSLDTQGVLAQVHPDLDTRSVLTQVHQGLENQGVLSQVHQSLDSRGVLTQVHPDLDTRGVLTQVHQDPETGGVLTQVRLESQNPLQVLAQTSFREVPLLQEHSTTYWEEKPEENLNRSQGGSVNLTHITPNTSLGFVQATPSRVLPSPTVNTREALDVIMDMFQAPTLLEDPLPGSSVFHTIQKENPGSSLGNVGRWTPFTIFQDEDKENCRSADADAVVEKNKPIRALAEIPVSKPAKSNVTPQDLIPDESTTWGAGYNSLHSLAACPNSTTDFAMLAQFVSTPFTHKTPLTSYQDQENDDNGAEVDDDGFIRRQAKKLSPILEQSPSEEKLSGTAAASLLATAATVAERHGTILPSTSTSSITILQPAPPAVLSFRDHTLCTSSGRSWEVYASPEQPVKDPTPQEPRSSVRTRTEAFQILVEEPENHCPRQDQNHRAQQVVPISPDTALRPDWMSMGSPQVVAEPDLDTFLSQGSPRTCCRSRTLEVHMGPKPSLRPEVSMSPEPRLRPDVPMSPEPRLRPDVPMSPEPRLRPDVPMSPEACLRPEVPMSPELHLRPDDPMSPGPRFRPEVPMSPEPHLGPQDLMSPEKLLCSDIPMSPEPPRQVPCVTAATEEPMSPDRGSPAGGTGESQKGAEPLHLVSDPWDDDLIRHLLSTLTPPLTAHPRCFTWRCNLPNMAAKTTISMGKASLQLDCVLGQGAFATVYQATDPVTSEKMVLKVQKPANPWEFYIHTQLDGRLHPSVRHLFSRMTSAHLFGSGSVLVGELHGYGTLLDLVNLYRSQPEKVIPQPLVLFFTSCLLHMVELLHSVQLLHADIKPDNFLLGDRFLDNRVVDLDSLDHGLVLVDLGQSIDLSFFPECTAFTAACQTSGFQCPEMLSGKPWSYQSDYFGAAGTAHCLLFGSYMKVVEEGGVWRTTANFRRNPHSELWQQFFHTLLNAPQGGAVTALRRLRADITRVLQLQYANKLTGLKSRLLVLLLEQHRATRR